MNYLKYIIIVLAFCATTSPLTAQVITTIVGPGNKIHRNNDQIDILPTITNANGVAVDDAGNVYVAEYWESSDLLGSIFKFSPFDTLNRHEGTIKRGENFPPPPELISYPHGIAVDRAGNMYVAEYSGHRALKITPKGKVTTVAGNGEQGYTGDNGNATAARLSLLNGIALDGKGNIYIADEFNNVIRKVTPGGIITTFAGTVWQGYRGDGRVANRALLNRPYGVAVDKTGNVYFSDTYNNVIRKVGTDGIINTIAGNGKEGYSGDGGPATDAQLNKPAGITLDDFGNMYVADEGNDVVRKISANGLVSTVAGNGKRGYQGDGEQAIRAELSEPRDVAIDHIGNMYIADFGNHVIRKVTTRRAATPLPKLTIVPEVAMPVAFTLKPSVSTQPIGTLILVFTPKPCAKMPLRSTVEIPVDISPVVSQPSVTIPHIAAVNFVTPDYVSKIHVLSAIAVSPPLRPVIPSPPSATVPAAPALLLVAPTPETKIPLSSAIEISQALPPVIPSPPSAAVPAAPALRLVAPSPVTKMPLSSAIEVSPVLQPFIPAPPSAIVPPAPALHLVTPAPAVKIPLLSAIEVSPALLLVISPPPVSTIPVVTILEPAVTIPLLPATTFPVSVPLPDTSQAEVEIPAVDVPELAIIPPQEPEDKVTVSINSDNIMTIDAESGTYSSFTITSMTGEKIMEQLIKARQVNVDLATLPPGNYYINLKSENETKILRFVKEN